MTGPAMVASRHVLHFLDIQVCFALYQIFQSFKLMGFI